MSFGIWYDFYKRTYVNTTAPALNQTNLNYDQTLMGLVDQELERSNTYNFNYMKHYYFTRNVKEINGKFMDSSDWSSAHGTISDDTANAVCNGTCIKVLQPDATADWNDIYVTGATTQDFSEFNDGHSSSTDDGFFMLFYISDISKFQNIRIRLGDDSTHYYEAVVSSSYFDTGWNCAYFVKSIFIDTTSPTGWDNIDYLYFAWQSTTSASNEYMLIQLFNLTRTDPEFAGYLNPFQYQDLPNTQWVNDISFVSDGWILYYDEKLQQIAIATTTIVYNNELILNSHGDVYSFIIQIEVECHDAERTPAITWRYNASNYIQVYVVSDSLRMRIVESGSPSDVISYFNGDLEIGYRAYVKFEKHGGQVRATATIEITGGNTETVNVEYKTVITGSGSLRIGTQTATYGRSNILNLLITHTTGHGRIANWENNSTIVIKRADESISDSTTLQDDDELVVTLPPNGVYQVDLYLNVDGSPNGKDIDVDWSNTNIEANEHYRICIGPGQNATSVYNCDAVHLQSHAFTTTVTYGIVGSGWSRIHETAIVETTHLEGTIQIRWAQNVAGGGTEYTIVKAGSCIIAKKLSTAPLQNKENYRTLTT